MDLTQLTLADLQGLLKEIERESKRRKKSEVEAAINEIYAIAHRLGKPLEELIGNGAIRKSSGKVAAQYRNPDNKSQEWTGRGRQPNWIKQLLASGVDIQTLKL